MKYIYDVYFSIWAILNLGICAAVSYVTYAIMSLSYDEMHTMSTAMDPDPNLTRATVLHNVLVQSGWGFTVLFIFGVLVWGLNAVIFWGGPSNAYRKHSLWLLKACSLILISSVVFAGLYCLSKYPQGG